MPNLREACVGYIELRSKKKIITAGHKEELAPLNDSMKKLEAFILDKMGKEGLQNFGADDGSGTVYKSSRSSVKVQDWGVFLEWIQENEGWDFITRRAADAVVKEYLDVEGHLPPGLSISTEQTLGVRAT